MKPIIRHCRNCEYAKDCVPIHPKYCSVKYKTIPENRQRICGLFCRFFKNKYEGRKINKAVPNKKVKFCKDCDFNDGGMCVCMTKCPKGE